MDFVSYRGVWLSCIRSHWAREPQYDPSDSTYLFTRWRGHVECLYNPGATSFQFANGGVRSAGPFTFAAAVPTTWPAPGQPVELPPYVNVQPSPMPVVTDATIRQALETPRGQLVVVSAGRLVLVSPKGTTAPGPNGRIVPVSRVCDADNGPKVRVHSITEIAGERLWHITLSFETALNEGPEVSALTTPLYTVANPSPPGSVILSNRWSVTHTVGDQHTTQRVINGVCIARADLLRDPNFVVNPGVLDAFRANFAAHTIPINFKREPVEVTVSPDGNTANYTIVDTEQLFNTPGVVNERVPRVESHEKQWMSRGSALRGILGVTSEGAGGIVGIVGAGLAMSPMGITQATWNGASGMTRAAAAQLPKRYMNCTVRVWGGRLNPRPRMVALAMAIAAGRMLRTSMFDALTSELVVSQDTNNYVEVSSTIAWDYQTTIGPVPAGLIALLAGFGPTTGAGDTSFAAACMQDSDYNIAGALAGQISNPVLTQNDAFNPALWPEAPRAVTTQPCGVRGSALQAILTQTLEGFQQPPATPV